MSEVDEDSWELSPGNSHPIAARILTDDFYWDEGDENSPFGNDHGADTFAFFREWREDHPESSPVKFLDQLLQEWEASNEGWDVTEQAEVERLLEDDEFSLGTRDDAVIAVAFGQLILEGKMEPEINRRALVALERQSLPLILKGWGENAAERTERLEKMKAALAQV